MSGDEKLVNRVGPWVMGKDFWDREQELVALREHLDAGDNLLLVAPRRVGKTSLMRESLRRLASEGKVYGLFVDVQDCATPEEVIVAISMATQPFAGLWQKIRKVFASILATLSDKLEEVGNDLISIKLREGVAGDWRAKGNRILEELAQSDKPVILCLDELPVMLIRLLTSREKADAEKHRHTAEVFLAWLRKNCLDHQGRVCFVICGSIGLEPVARRFGLSHAIAHLHPFHLNSWPRPVADGCLEALAANYQLSLPLEVRSAMLDELVCFIPHHVQMFFSHVKDDCRSSGSSQPTIDDIQRVYQRQMLGTRGHAELADYEERLRRVLGTDLQPLALDLLTQAAVVDVLTLKAARLMAKEAGLGPDDARAAVRTLIDVLEHDGYLTRREPPQEDGWVFVSKLVKDWWRRRFGDGFIPAEERGV